MFKIFNKKKTTNDNTMKEYVFTNEEKARKCYENISTNTKRMVWFVHSEEKEFAGLIIPERWTVVVK